jgi:hypothetical protein
MSIFGFRYDKRRLNIILDRSLSTVAQKFECSDPIILIHRGHNTPYDGGGCYCYHLTSRAQVLPRPGPHWEYGNVWSSL